MGTAMAVASSSSLDIVGLILSKLAIRRFFAATLSGQDVAQGKPAPDIFLKAAAEIRTQPQKCIVIEDSPAGIAEQRVPEWSASASPIPIPAS